MDRCEILCFLHVHNLVQFIFIHTSRIDLLLGRYTDHSNSIITENISVVSDASSIVDQIVRG